MRRRALAGLAASCVAVLVLLVSAHAGRTDTITYHYVPLSLTPECGDLGGNGVSVHATASGLAAGTYTISIGDQGPTHSDVTTAGTATVGDDGNLATDFAMPPQQYSGIFRVYIQRGGSIAGGYFSVPCPTITVAPTCGPADDGSGLRYALSITGTGWGPPPDSLRSSSSSGGLGFGILPVHIGADGGEFPGSPVTPNADGTFSVLVTPPRTTAGVHQIHAYTTTADAPNRISITVNVRDAYTPFTVPCPVTTTTTATTQTTTTTAATTATTTQTTTATPTTAPQTRATTTAPATQTTQTRTTAAPTGAITAAISPACLAPSATASSPVEVTGGNLAHGAAQVLVDGTLATNASAGADGGVKAQVEVTPGSSDHVIEIRQGPRLGDVTLRVPCASHPTLKVDPPLGSPGQVAQATGTGFPANVEVVLAWKPGIGSWTVRTDAHGSLVASVLVFPQDQCDDRVLRATPVARHRFPGVDVKFLCVPGSVQQPQTDTFDFRR